MARGSGPAGAAGPADPPYRPAPYYPVFLDVAGRRCVVVGDDAIAAAKVAGLRQAGADVVHLRRPYREGDLDGAFLAIEATGDPASRQAARRAADRLGTLLNVLDVPGSCDWIAPAVMRRGPLQVAVSTAGESPLLAQDVRDRLAREYGEEWGEFTSLLGEVRRRLRRDRAPLSTQRSTHRRLMRSAVRSLLRAGQADGAWALARDLEQAVSGSPDTAALGEVVLAGAGPGSAELVTVGTREALAAADIVFHDALIEPEVLRLCGPQVQVVDVGRRSGCHSPSQAEINDLLIEAARDGRQVVRLKGGDPMLLARGGEEMAALIAAGVPVRVIPGVSAAIAAAGAAGIPLTHRGVAASVSIVAGHSASGQSERLEAIAASAETLVVLMPHDLAAIAGRIARVVGADRPAALIIGATTRHERTLRAPVGTIAAAAQRLQRSAPATLVVGEVVGLLDGARNQPPDAVTVAMTRAASGLSGTQRPNQYGPS